MQKRYLWNDVDVDMAGFIEGITNAVSVRCGEAHTVLLTKGGNNIHQHTININITPVPFKPPLIFHHSSQQGM